MAATADQLNVLGLTIVESSVLILIGSNPGIFQSEIGRVLGIKRTNVVPLAATLERRGLIDRTEPDGRLVGLACTTEGERTARAAEQIMKVNDDRLFGHFSPELRKQMRSVLETLWTESERSR